MTDHDTVDLAPVRGDIDALLAVRDQIAALKDTETRLRQAIEHHMGDAQNGTLDGDTIITWRVGAKPRRFNQSAFKAAHPDLAAEYTELGEPARPFKVVG